jgi:hypothetical protein
MRPWLWPVISDQSIIISQGEANMASSQAGLGKTLMWGGMTALLYWTLFNYAGDFIRLAHTTLDACLVQEGMNSVYYNKATPELCAAQEGAFIKGTWWYVFAPIAMAFALSYTHGLFTGLFWDVIGLKAKQ